MTTEQGDQSASAGKVELFEGRIERLGWGGIGIARHADGRIVLLRHAEALFPGEHVEAEIEWRTRHAEGVVKEILEPATERVRSECAFSASCGGCSLHGAATRGSALKKLMVDDLLGKQLGRDITYEWFPALPDTLRNVIQLHLADGQLGYYSSQSHDPVEVSSCPAARPPLSAAIESVRSAIDNGGLPALNGRWELACGHPAETVMLWHESEPGRVWQLCEADWCECEGMLHWRLPHREIASHASGFFQVTGPSAIRFFDELFSNWQLGGDRLHDLYGGCGLFSCLLADRFSSFAVVDSSQASVTSAAANLHGMEARCFQRDVGRHITGMRSRPGDVIILDPPRSGLTKQVCADLNDQGAGCLVLVGCDGAAFCRDIGRLRQCWRPERLAVADLFPWTQHCEFVGLLVNRAG